MLFFELVSLAEQNKHHTYNLYILKVNI